MIHLRPNATQNFYVTPFQARKYLPTFTKYLMEVKRSGSDTANRFIINAQLDNERYTRAVINTSTKDPVGGDIILDEPGMYSYKIYGQNSSTNLDPDDSSVVGLCESGSLRVTMEDDAWTTPTISIPNNVIYYE